MAQMFSHLGQPSAKRNRIGMFKFTGRILTTTAGAISTASTAPKTPYFTVTRNSAGNYTVQCINSDGVACGGFNVFEGYSIQIIAANAPYTAGKGAVAFIKSESPSAGSFVILIGRANGTTDYTATDVEDGASISITFEAKRSTATP